MEYLSIHDKLNYIIRKVDEMTVSQATFDTDLAALVAAITTLNAAVDAWIAAQPVGVDLSAEDQEVANAAAAVAAELAKVTPATPGA